MKRTKNSKDVAWLAGTTIVVFGDSITADPRANYVTLLLERLACSIDVSGITVINSGVDSSSVFDVCDRVPDVMCQGKPDVALILVGVNDSKIMRYGGASLVDLESFERAYERLLGQLSAHGVTRCVLITPPRFLFARARSSALLREYWYWVPSEYAKYVEVVRQLAKRRGCALADVFARMKKCARSELIKCYFSDGVHPNLYGHRIIAEEVGHALGEFNCDR